MKYSIFFIIMIVTGLFLGCPARSMNPLFTSDETVFNPALVGTWVSDDVIISFTRSTENNYRTVYKDKQSLDSLIYTVQLGKINSEWYLDSYPADNPKDDHLVPAHMITKIWFDKNQLFLSTLESDWLKKMIDNNRLKIPHIRRGNEIILTASTATLQQLVEKFGSNKEAFPANGSPFKKK